jgi:hypothetical protein
MAVRTTSIREQIAEESRRSPHSTASRRTCRLSLATTPLIPHGSMPRRAHANAGETACRRLLAGTLAVASWWIRSVFRRLSLAPSHAQILRELLLAAKYLRQIWPRPLPHTPLGHVWTIQERRALATLVKELPALHREILRVAIGRREASHSLGDWCGDPSFLSLLCGRAFGIKQPELRHKSNRLSLFSVHGASGSGTVWIDRFDQQILTHSQ